MLVLRPFLLLMDHPQLVAGSHQSLSRLVAVSLPPQLESLTFGHDFNKELKDATGAMSILTNIIVLIIIWLVPAKMVRLLIAKCTMTRMFLQI